MALAPRLSVPLRSTSDRRPIRNRFYDKGRRRAGGRAGVVDGGVIIPKVGAPLWIEHARLLSFLLCHYRARHPSHGSRGMRLSRERATPTLSRFVQQSRVTPTTESMPHFIPRDVQRDALFN